MHQYRLLLHSLSHPPTKVYVQNKNKQLCAEVCSRRMIEIPSFKLTYIYANQELINCKTYFWLNTPNGMILILTENIGKKSF